MLIDLCKTNLEKVNKMPAEGGGGGCLRREELQSLTWGLITASNQQAMAGPFSEPATNERDILFFKI